MAWKKGTSGNPAGRKPDAAIAEIRDAAQVYGPEAIERLVYWMRHDDNPRASIAACSVLLDRGYGKAMQKVDFEQNLSTIELFMKISNQRTERMVDVTPLPLPLTT